MKPGEKEGDKLRWVSLEDLDSVHAPLPDLHLTTPVKWSPDGHHLAFGACSPEEGTCGFYVLDVNTDRSDGAIMLHVQDRAGPSWPPLWSPDGGQVAYIGGPGEGQELLLLYVFEVEGGSLIYEGTFDPDEWRADTAAPVHNWGSNFPRSMSGFGRCSAKPQR